jgi:hypothetical protein
MLQVSLNGITFAKTGVRFWFYNLSNVLVAGLHPSGGPPAGGTLVNISGQGFVDYGGGVQGPRCRFGTRVVPATLQSLETASCYSPAQAAVADVPVWLSLNGYSDWRGVSGGRLRFRYGAAPTLSRAHPLGAPALGGSRLTVHGNGFADDGGVMDEDVAALPRFPYHLANYVKWPGDRTTRQSRPGLSCLFGDPVLATPATWLDSEQLLCLAPPLDALAGAVPVGDWCARRGHAHCQDPAYADVGVLMVPLRVSLNGNQTQYEEQTPLPWMVLPDGLPRVQAVEPWGGPAAGGTNVTVSGDGLLDFGSAFCRFDDVKVPAVIGGVSVDARSEMPLITTMPMHDGRSTPEVARRTARRLTCVAPQMSVATHLDVSLAVSLDGIHWSHAADYKVVMQVSLSSVTPNGGPLAGGTPITLRAPGFVSLSSAGVLCRIGDQTVQGTVSDDRELWTRTINAPTTTLASHGNPGQRLRCVTPAGASTGEVRVRVSLNNDLDEASLSALSMGFTYYDGVAVSSVSPAAGPLSGGNIVTVRGNGFALHGTPQCRFGAELPVRAFWAVNATDGATSDPAADSGAAVDEFVCYPPRVAQSGAVDVEVSLNGNSEQFTTSAAQYVYQDPCTPRGSIEYYDQVPGARDAVLDQLAAAYPDTTSYEYYDPAHPYLSDAALQTALNDSAPAPMASSSALEQFARDTCSSPGADDVKWSQSPEHDGEFDESLAAAGYASTDEIPDPEMPELERQYLPHGPPRGDPPNPPLHLAVLDEQHGLGLLDH